MQTLKRKKRRDEQKIKSKLTTVLDGKEKVGDGIDLLGRSAVPVGGGRGDQGFTGLGLWFEVVQAAIPAQCRHIQRAEVDLIGGIWCCRCRCCWLLFVEKDVYQGGNHKGVEE